MTTIQSGCLIACLLIGWVAPNIQAEEFADARLNNWHQWRGPLANGMAVRGNPPIRWSETENIRWKVKVPGQGKSTPIIWGDQLFLVSAIKTDQTPTVPEVPRAAPQPADARTQPAPTHVYQFKVFCFDKDTGQLLWDRTAAEVVPHRGHHRDGGYACASPTTDGERLYVCFGSQGMYCYDLTGNLLWSRDLGRMETFWDFGECVTPVVCGDKVILVYDQLGPSLIYALDTKTGETKWQADRDEEAGWSTPLIVERNGRRQVIRAGTNYTCSYDLDTGRLLWKCAGLGPTSVTSPVASDDMVYCMTYYDQPSLLAISLDSQGDVTDTDKVVWRYDRDTSYVPSPLILDETLFVIKDKIPILSVFDIHTGKVVRAAQRLHGLSGKIYASPVAIGKRIYFTSTGGETLVVEKHISDLKQLSLNKLDDSFVASPAIAGNRMYLRGENHLYCIEER